MKLAPIYNKLFSSLTKRIITLNLFALIILLCGIISINQFKEGLIEAKIESLLTQGQIIAGAISTSASISSKISYYYLDENKMESKKRARRKYSDLQIEIIRNIFQTNKTSKKDMCLFLEKNHDIKVSVTTFNKIINGNY